MHEEESGAASAFVEREHAILQVHRARGAAAKIGDRLSEQGRRRIAIDVVGPHLDAELLADAERELEREDRFAAAVEEVLGHVDRRNPQYAGHEAGHGGLIGRHH